MNASYSKEEDLPGNDSALADLRSAFADQRVICFAGAGVSAPIWPFWNDLLERLADAAVESGRASAADRAAWLASDNLEMAAELIEAALGRDELTTKLRELFGPPRTGSAFTDMQASVVSRPFAAIVTTNYDPGLLAARAAIMPSSRWTGHTNGADADSLAPWITAGAFDRDELALLHLHGTYERPSTIVLTKGQYEKSYARPILSALLKSLFLQSTVVFVGFSLRDERINFLMRSVLAMFGSSGTTPRHFAVLGIEESIPYSPELRRQHRLDTGIEPIFYRIDNTSPSPHRGALDILTSLPQRTSDDGGTSALSGPDRGMNTRWLHSGTADRFHIDRANETGLLSRWIDDETVRGVAITGVGGTGKTALVERWLNDYRPSDPSRFESAIFWSFYANPDPAALFEAIVQWGIEHAGHVRAPDRERGDQALGLVEENSLLLVLDGLEVVQEIQGSTAHGSIIHQALRQVVNMCLRAGPNGSKLIVTSRFPIADFDAHIGGATRWLPLAGLSDEQGATLLKRLGAGADESSRLTAANRFSGHPLALRVLARSVDAAEGALADVTQAASTDQGTLSSKIGTLLAYYFDRIPSTEFRALEAVSVFRHPVELEALTAILPVVSLEKSELERALLDLVAAGLCVKTPDGFGCHPVLRDSVRTQIMSANVDLADVAVRIIQAAPLGPDATEAHQTMEAAIFLLEVERPWEAIQLVHSSLRSGQTILSLPAVSEGMEILDRLMTHKNVAQLQNESNLYNLQTLTTVLWPLAEAARLSGAVGLATGALQVATDAISTITWSGGEVPPYIQEMLELTELRLLLDQGKIQEAASVARIMDHPLGEAWIMSIRSGNREPSDRFDAARKSVTGADSTLGDLVGYECCWWVEHLLAVGEFDRALEVARRNETVCEREPIYTLRAETQRLTGLALLACGDLDAAGLKLRIASETATQTRQLRAIVEIDIGIALVELCQGELASASGRIATALSVAGSRGWRILHVDALDLRVCLATIEGELSVVSDDFDSQAEMLANRIPYHRRLHRKLAAILLADVL